MTVDELIKILQGYNKTYTVKQIDVRKYQPEVVILDMNNHVIKILHL